MQLARLTVDGLFSRFHHEIPFPTRPEDGDEEGAPSITILHGPNGIGKTTVLRMLNGIMKLDFSIFRMVPFEACALQFSTGERLLVKPTSVGSERPLEVAFQEDMVQQDDVQAFREGFFSHIEGLNFDFIETSRIHPNPKRDEDDYGELVEWVLHLSAVALTCFAPRIVRPDHGLRLRAPRHGNEAAFQSPPQRTGRSGRGEWRPLH
jgi:energy-coupling factor transporter ATP-binding protein EcfA2